MFDGGLPQTWMQGQQACVGGQAPGHAAQPLQGGEKVSPISALLDVQ